MNSLTLVVCMTGMLSLMFITFDQHTYSRLAIESLIKKTQDEYLFEGLIRYALHYYLSHEGKVPPSLWINKPVKAHLQYMGKGDRMFCRITLNGCCKEIELNRL